MAGWVVCRALRPKQLHVIRLAGLKIAGLGKIRQEINAIKWISALIMLKAGKAKGNEGCQQYSNLLRKLHFKHVEQKPEVEATVAGRV